MNYRIEKKEAFEVYGVATEINSVDGNAFIEVPEFWDKCDADGSADRILKYSGRLCTNAVAFNPRENEFTYMLCDYVPEGGVPDDFTRLAVPSFMWAIFPTDEKGSRTAGQQVQDIWKRLFTEWFPTSGYEHADGPEFEMYWNKGEGIYKAEVWVPVLKR